MNTKNKAITVTTTFVNPREELSGYVTHISSAITQAESVIVALRTAVASGSLPLAAVVSTLDAVSTLLDAADVEPLHRAIETGFPVSAQSDAVTQGAPKRRGRGRRAAPPEASADASNSSTSAEGEVSQ